MILLINYLKIRLIICFNSKLSFPNSLENFRIIRFDHAQNSDYQIFTVFRSEGQKLPNSPVCRPGLEFFYFRIPLKSSESVVS